MDALRLTVALALFAGARADGFASSENILTTTIAFGSATANNGAAAFFPGSEGGAPGVFATFDGGNTVNYSQQSTVGMIPLSIAGDGDQRLLAAGLFGAASSSDQGATFDSVMSALPSKLISSQGVRYQSSQWAIPGQFMSSEASDGIAMSSDDMASWSLVPVSGFHQAGVLRYGSFPTASTFYVTAGIWNTTEVSAAPAGARPISAFLHVTKNKKLAATPRPPADGQGQGWWAQVAKTTDGGATWEIVYENLNNGYYPNEIDCFDESHCTFVMEGLGQPQVVSTSDGGATWESVLVDPSSDSLMSARMVDTSEAWVAGGGDVGRMWHSTDMANWAEYTVDIKTAASFTSFDLDEDAGVVYATGVLRSQLCSVVKATF